MILGFVLRIERKAWHFSAANEGEECPRVM